MQFFQVKQCLAFLNLIKPIIKPRLIDEAHQNVTLRFYFVFHIYVLAFHRLHKYKLRRLINFLGHSRYYFVPTLCYRNFRIGSICKRDRLAFIDKELPLGSLQIDGIWSVKIDAGG